MGGYENDCAIFHGPVADFYRPHTVQRCQPLLARHHFAVAVFPFGQASRRGRASADGCQAASFMPSYARRHPSVFSASTIVENQFIDADFTRRQCSSFR